MPAVTIQSISAVDARFALPPGAGTDSVHTNPEYCMAVTLLSGDRNLSASGIALTLGDGRAASTRLLRHPARPRTWS